MKLIFAISIVALSFFGTACRRSVGEMILVPMPQEATFTGGYFETDSARFVERAGDGYVACRIDPSAPEIRPEGYRLKVTRRGIDLCLLALEADTPEQIAASYAFNKHGFYQE